MNVTGKFDQLVRQVMQTFGFMAEPERSDYMVILIGEMVQQLANKQQIELKETDKHLIKGLKLQDDPH